MKMDKFIEITTWIPAYEQLKIARQDWIDSMRAGDLESKPPKFSDYKDEVDGNIIINSDYIVSVEPLLDLFLITMATKSPITDKPMKYYVKEIVFETKHQ